MIRVDQLTKKYAGITAIDAISFEVGKGEIVGFLGPNGAGKSTTMRILSGYLPPTSGSASVAGFDVFHHSVKARERIGYMPENVPLYQEMRVSEYLRYRAALKGVRGRKLRERLTDVVDLCNLKDVERKLIGALSKGYRQRVGLADAMIHEPDLLVLDEPTIGLDPNQIRQVRELIRNLGRHHTILLSTHILPEVEMTCGRVIIINRGKIEAVDTPENLRRRLQTGGAVLLDIAADHSSPARKEFEKWDAVLSVEVALKSADWVRLRIETKDDGDLRPEVFRICARQNWMLRELTRERVTLEDVFTEITEGEPL
jgi:ABC-2 type transport system ATP-binding protein